MVALGWYRALVRSAVLLVLMAVVSGCAATTRTPVALTTTFDAQAAAFINASGRATISGQAFVRQKNGRLWRAVGTDVFLIPRTAYADERIAAIYGNAKGRARGGPILEDNSLYEQYMRKTIASSAGSFRFDNVADGEYYVIAMIPLPNDVMFYEFPIFERVTVQGGKSVRLVVRGY